MNPEILQGNETSEFLWRRLSEDCPTWAIGVPVLFAFLVLALIVIFRPDKKLMTAAIGGSIVGVFSLLYLFLGFFLVRVQGASWLVILVPVIGMALFYVGLMYIRDARSVHWLWAIFLGGLRTTVYAILAVVFLMPGCQHFDKQEYHSKTLFVFDVSGSMLFVIDDLPEEGQDPGKMPSRQDKILKWLAANADEQGREKIPFVDRVLAKTPLSVYRFGSIPDEGNVLHLTKDKSIPFADASIFLEPNMKDIERPDVSNLGADKAKDKLAEYAKKIDMIETLRTSGTNIGGSLLQIHKLENSSFIQAIVIVSDGQSNLGSDDSRLEFLNRVNNPKRPIPVITVGVGQFRMPASIRIDDLLAPEETRPDDKFNMVVPVVSTGLQGEKFTVNVWIQRKKDVTGKEVDESPIPLGEKVGEFKGAGDLQEGKVPYEIDLQDLKKIKSADDKNNILEGEWHLWAKVPRAAFPNGKAKEAFADPFHVSEVVKVQVQKRALRVLLFAGGSTREYQFLRTILYREMLEKRMELCILNQSTVKEDHVDQDVEPERMLTEFPSRFGPNVGTEKFMSLNDYDVIVAFDPDWEKLTMKQRGALEEWVGTHAGGVIFVAGPVYSYKLARPGGKDYTPILKIFPVVLKDSRIHGLGLPGTGLGHDATRPWPLNFNPVAKEFDFLKLDESSESSTAGWKGFFWNDEKISDAGTFGAKPKRGFFTYYPVERLKPASQVAATFAGPKEARIGPSDDFKDQMPFLVTMPFAGGKTMYVGSGEFWRMRAYKEGFQERLWIKILRHVASGGTQQKKYGRILMARTSAVGPINVEAQIKGKDFQFLGPDERPTVIVKRVDKNRPVAEPGKDKDGKEPASNLKTIILQAKPTEGPWRGDFVGSIPIKEAGEYEFTIPIKNLPTEALRHTLIVRKPNPELDNVRTNFGYLYQMASESKMLPSTISPEVRKEIEAAVQVPGDQAPVDGGAAAKRLFFPLSSADTVAKCLVSVPPKTDIIRQGPPEDLWARGLKTNRAVTAYLAALLAPLVIGVIGVIILLLLRQWVSALIFFGICVLMTIGVAVTDVVFTKLLTDVLDVDFSYLLVTVVSLLGIEWLARKLLRLA
ncbi:MAG: VWA domain-containing protein [Gemmataceae bacterium]|nr:VWA domain-containing protein [Gemmataceae bacterium]